MFVKMASLRWNKVIVIYTIQTLIRLHWLALLVEHSDHCTAWYHPFLSEWNKLLKHKRAKCLIVFYFQSFSLVNEDRENGGAPTRFSEWMNKPGIIQRPGNYDMFLRGIATQPQQAQDIFFSEEVSTLMNSVMIYYLFVSGLFVN